MRSCFAMSSSPKEKGAAEAAPPWNPPRVPESEDRIARRHPVSGTSRCFGSQRISRSAGGVSRAGGEGAERVGETFDQEPDRSVVDDERRRDPQDLGSGILRG